MTTLDDFKAELADTIEEMGEAIDAGADEAIEDLDAVEAEDVAEEDQDTTDVDE